MGVVALVTQHSGEAQPLLNNRDLAALFWLAVLVVFAIVKRINVRPVLQAMKGSILLVFVGLGMWTWLEVNLGARLGWWTGDLLKDTVVWFFTTAVALLFGFQKMLRAGGFFRLKVKAAVRAAVFVEVFVNLYVFPLWVELLLPPVLVLLAGVTTIARNDQEPVKRLAEWLQIAIGFMVLGYVVFQFATRWRGLDEALLARQLALPVWLTLGVCPSSTA